MHTSASLLSATTLPLSKRGNDLKGHASYCIDVSLYLRGEMTTRPVSLTCVLSAYFQ